MMNSPLASNQRKPLILAGICLGIGLGGFFDGIVLHQILQWHHMLSNVLPLTNRSNIDLNVLEKWDISRNRKRDDYCRSCFVMESREAR